MEDLSQQNRLKMSTLFCDVLLLLSWSVWHLVLRLEQIHYKLTPESTNYGKYIEGNSTYLSYCYTKNGYIYTSRYIWAIILPFFINPIFNRCLQMIKSQRNVILAGMLFLTAEIVTLKLIEILARSNVLNVQNNSNITFLHCYDFGSLYGSLDYRWMVIESFFVHCQQLLLELEVQNSEFLKPHIP